MSRKIIPTIWGKGQRFPRVEPSLTFRSLMVSLGTVLAPVGVSFSLLMKQRVFKGLAEVNSATILNLFGSNYFMLCSQAMSFF